MEINSNSEAHFTDMCTFFNIDPEWFTLKSKIFGTLTWKVKPEYTEQYKNIEPQITEYLTTFTVEIDSPPGSIRPDDHFVDMCKYCQANPEWFELKTKLFGNWTWDVKPEYNKEYKQVKPQIAEFLKSLYNNGFIRYASW